MLVVAPPAGERVGHRVDVGVGVRGVAVGQRVRVGVGVGAGANFLGNGV